MADTYDLTNPAKPMIFKDPNAVLDYIMDWTAWLDDIADTIASHLVTVPTGIVLDSSLVVGKTVVAWLSGGTVGQTYQIVFRIVTTGLRTDERSIFVKIKER